MQTFLGNLSLEDMERRTGVSFPQELKDYLAPRRQEKVRNIEPGKWHCFDIPFALHCGDMETATQIYGYLKPLAADFKEQFEICINGNS
jgi:hypothetical protein